MSRRGKIRALENPKLTALKAACKAQKEVKAWTNADIAEHAGISLGSVNSFFSNVNLCVPSARKILTVLEVPIPEELQEK